MLYNQAAKIIAKFGSPYTMSKYVGVTPASIYKWTWPRERGGTNGLIPAASMSSVIRGARILGIHLTAEDLFPEIIDNETE